MTIQSPPELVLPQFHARPPRISPKSPALLATDALVYELRSLGIIGDVHDGYGLALVSLWADLVVWTNGDYYLWWSGRHCPRTNRRSYAYHDAKDPLTAAQRIASRYGALRRERYAKNPEDEHALFELVRSTARDRS
ncbi:hypothetical protein [Planomonospora sp. ID82291]|uniref:hypothetical protein n=1 Tax=Planomonospora sp. ID82291 TaxID=2738136 RepID=UPI0018C37CCF|nr:hypothetical protein [Planomonospora sp. ID82291]MBG0814652.1 hypothetical protein [Planomonospora sp. ID82291]